MDKNIKHQFESVRREYGKLKQGAIDNLSAYRSGMEQVRREASKYKDEKAYIDEHGRDLKYSTRKKIEESEKEFCDYIHGTIIPALRTALVDHMTAAPDRAFMQTLTYYNEFGIKLDAAEVKALSYDASGNSLALRCLASIAEKVVFPFDSLPSKSTAELLTGWNEWRNRRCCLLAVWTTSPRPHRLCQIRLCAGMMGVSTAQPEGPAART